MYDVVVVGAGPVGLACAIEAKREGLRPRVIDKGALVNSIVGYPARMEFFSTPELIEIGGYPFPVQGYKPTREDAIEYYRGVAAQEKLDVRLYERVDRRRRRARATSRSRPTAASTARATSSSRSASSISPTCSTCPARTCRRSRTTTASRIAYVRQKVAVIGARNSAAKAALDCYRHGAEVTLVVRGRCCPTRSSTGSSRTSRTASRKAASRRFFNTSVAAIDAATRSLLRTPEGERDDRQRLGAGDDRLSPGLRLPRARSADRHRRRSLPHAGLRRGDVRDAAGPASTSPARCAAATRPAAGSSRTAASTPSRSPGTSPTARATASRSSGSTGRRKSELGRPACRRRSARSAACRPSASSCRSSGCATATTPTSTSCAPATSSRAQGSNPRVTMQVFQKQAAWLGGVDEAIAILKTCLTEGYAWDGPRGLRRFVTAIASSRARP